MKPKMKRKAKYTGDESNVKLSKDLLLIVRKKMKEYGHKTLTGYATESMSNYKRGE